MIETSKYVRTPFEVEAVQVTEQNMAEVAAWCGGEVQHETGSGPGHIDVKVHRPMTPRQSTAKVGDWVLFAGNGFKVYTPRAFEKSFKQVGTTTKIIPSPAEREAKSITIPGTASAEEVVELLTTTEPATAVSAQPSPAFLASLAASRQG